MQRQRLRVCFGLAVVSLYFLSVGRIFYWNGLVDDDLKKQESSTFLVPRKPAASTSGSKLSRAIVSSGEIMRRRQVKRNRETESERKARLRERSRLQAAAMANYSRPRLEDIISDESVITGDPQFLLDFAVVGFGKCGTSTMMHWLADHPEVKSFREELYELMHSEPASLVRKLYHELPPGRYKRGYKSPGEITQAHIIEYFRLYWPKTRLIIGVRHPIRWFESLYNFRVQNLPKGQTMLSPNKLIGKCHGQTRQCCTEKGNFAYSLLRLGKSKRHSELEEQIVGKYKRNWFNVSRVKYVPNPVFLFELGQLSDENLTRSERFRHDFHKFMGLREPLPPLEHHRPGQSWGADLQQEKDKLKIDICDEKWIPVRRALLRLARQGSLWIRSVFLGSPDVSVSSRDHLEYLLRNWMNDPCGTDTDVIRAKGVPAIPLPG